MIQEATTIPPPLLCVQDWPCEAACFIVYPFAFKDAEDTLVGEAEEFFARICYQIDQACGESTACRYFLNAFDEWPRKEMISNLLAEVKKELDERIKRDTLVA